MTLEATGLNGGPTNWLQTLDAAQCMMGFATAVPCNFLPSTLKSAWQNKQMPDASLTTDTCGRKRPYALSMFAWSAAQSTPTGTDSAEALQGLFCDA